MSHYHLNALDLKDFHFLKAAAQARPVHITADGTKHGRNGFEAVGKVITADVASVPHLVTVGKVLRVTVVPPRVRVADNAYLFHWTIDVLLKPSDFSP